MSVEFEAARFKKYLDGSKALLSRGIESTVFGELDSTNSEARRRALEKDADKNRTRVIIALSQSAGRGRMGRSFFSPSDSGLYFTMLLDVSETSPEATLCLTPAAAVAVVRTVKELGVANAEIKWVNDILIDGKKACGILAEAFTVGEKRYVALGIGINLYAGSFPSELEHIATSFFDGAEIDGRKRRRILWRAAEKLASELFDLKQMIDSGDLSYMDEYRRASAVMGRNVSYSIFRDGSETVGTAVGIDDYGRLSVRDRSGEITVLSGGEITLRLE